MYRECIDPPLRVPAAVPWARRQPHERGAMDFVVIAIVVVFFAVSAAVVGLLDRL
jgi:hypothetical protein